MNMAVKPIDLVARYIRLRGQMQDADKAYAEWRKLHYDEPMRDIEQEFTKLFDETGSDSIKTRSGTVYRKISTSVTTADNAALRHWVIEGQNWDVVDWKPNKTAVNDMFAKGEGLPPGVNRSTFMSVHILRPKEK